MEKKNTFKKVLIIVLSVLLIALIAALVINAKYALFDGKLIRRDIGTLDLRGMSISESEYNKIVETFPDAYIYRDVQIGNCSFDVDERDIVTGDFSVADVDRFRVFRSLRSVDASACSDMNAVLALKEQYPDVNVYWTVTLEGTQYSGDTTELALPGANYSELCTALERMPDLTSVSITGKALSLEEERKLMEAWPGVSFDWDVVLGGRTFRPADAVLDFTNTPLNEGDLQEIGQYLNLLPHAESINFTGCGLSNDVIQKFANAYPHVAVGWETELFGVKFSTLAEEIDFDDIEMTIQDAAAIEKLLPLMPNLKKVSMCRCGISNEDMDQLNKRHDDVDFVWMVQVLNYGIPTDQTFFCVWNCPYEYPESNMDFSALKYCTKMEAIDLGHQKLYGTEGTSFLSNLTELKYLTLCDCQYTEVPELADLKNLVFLEMYWTNMDDISPLKELTNLKALNIVYKRVRDTEQDLQILCSMTWLEKLYVSANMYGYDQLERIRASLPNCDVVVIETLDCCSMGWRSDNKYYYDYRDALHMYYISDESDQIFVNPFTGEHSLYEDTNPF